MRLSAGFLRLVSVLGAAPQAPFTGNHQDLSKQYHSSPKRFMLNHLSKKSNEKDFEDSASPTF